MAKRLKALGAVSAILLAVALFFFAAGKVKNGITVSSVRPDSPVIVIDPGHGGMDGGAIGSGGTVEKDLNLDISLRLRDFLAVSGFRVVMTRDSDVAIYDDGVKGTREQKKSDMHNRLKIMEDIPGAIVLSIHQNQFTQSRYSGAQMFYGRNNPMSQKLAGSIQSSFKNLLQPDNKREIKPGGKDLYLLWQCENPIVLVECGFISNPEECQKLQDPEYQREAAFAVLAGLLDTLAAQGGEMEIPEQT